VRADVHHVCALMHVFHIMMVHAGTCSAKDSLVGKGKEVAGGLMGKPGMKEEGESLQTFGNVLLRMCPNRLRWRCVHEVRDHWRQSLLLQFASGALLPIGQIQNLAC